MALDRAQGRLLQPRRRGDDEPRGLHLESRRSHEGRRALVFGVTLSLAACGSAGPESLFDLTLLDPMPAADSTPATRDFYRLPYPNDLRIDADGTPALARYPRPEPLPSVYTDVIDANGRGFGATQASYFRFDAALDPGALPLPAETQRDGSPVLLVDVTPGSAHLGEKVPVELKFQAEALEYIGDDWLAVHPVPGFAPREGETYAVVVLDALTGTGGHLRPPAALVRVLAGKPQTEHEKRAVTVYAPLVAWLRTQPTIEGHVAAATVYTTQKGSAIMDELRVAVNAQPAPVLTSLAHDAGRSTTTFDLYAGLYNTPNYQVGDPPYSTTGGMLDRDASGALVPTRTEMIRVAMTVPKGTMPESGWPCMLIAHGTGGDYETFVADGTAGRFAVVTAKDGTELARFLVLSIDQVLHGTRAPAGTDPALAFFNFDNILAARDNPKQGALDDFQLMRLVKSLNVTHAPDTAASFRCDANELYFFGHSQGSVTGSLYVGSEPALKAAIFSGASAGLVTTLLYKTQPVDVQQIVQAFFADPIDPFHPFLNVLQGFFDESDPASYTRRYLVEPPAGFAPKSIFVSLGLDDSYAPDPTILPFALGAGVVPVSPQRLAVDPLDLSGKTFVDPPVVANEPNGATGVLCEYDPKDSSFAGDDGHFVIFDVPAAEAQSTRFFGTHVRTGSATLDPP